MILSCSFCHTRYLIPAALFAAGPRQVRCARCSHSWLAELPNEIDAVGTPPDLDLSPAPEGAMPIPEGSGLPVVRKNPMIVLLQGTMALSWMLGLALVLVLALLLGKTWIAGHWPAAEVFYDAIGFHVYHFGEGLSFVEVRSELRYDGGQTTLSVEGKILNDTTNVQPIPKVKVTALGADGNGLQSWQIDAPAPRLFAGEAVPFKSSIIAPQSAVTEINLSFVEKNEHDPE
ncbi:MAG: zinc-ribbon domain-containing protein [Pseudomonadota bacterium]|nr:zinc-ribbon domain-containing protein [Pseudomonadota bacterium]